MPSIITAMKAFGFFIAAILADVMLYHVYTSFSSFITNVLSLAVLTFFVYSAIVVLTLVIPTIILFTETSEET